MSEPRVPKIRPWSKDKLALLGKYLNAYSRIMSLRRATWLRSYSYIDAFAGMGTHLDPDTQDYVDGSPFVALRCDPPFDDYWFIESSPGRLRALQERVKKEYPDRRVHFCLGDANEILVTKIAQRITYPAFRRGLVFLDPFGFELKFDTLRCLSETRALDVFVNFSVMGVTRVLERTDLPDERVQNMLQRLLGDLDILEDLYTIHRRGLFDSLERRERPRVTALDVAEAYLARVRRLFPHVSVPVVMRNLQGARLYALFLASHRPEAVKITNSIFKRYERLRQQRP